MSCAFARDEVDALILRHLRASTTLSALQGVERWAGVHPVSPEDDAVIVAPDAATRLVLVTCGTGASTAFALAEDVFATW
jgi:hypothetical protein